MSDDDFTGHGKLGPNGGVIDIDDPCERFPDAEGAARLAAAVQRAFRQLVMAVEQPTNRDYFIEKAAITLAKAIRSESR